MTEETPPPIDRPLECSECKKPIAFRYTEMVGDQVTEFHCCADCPVLKRKLSGLQGGDGGLAQLGIQADLACGNCGTTLEAVRMGSLLGCSSCYDVFEEVLLIELQNAGRLPPHLQTTKRSSLIHIGRSPGQTREINPAMKLLALNEALEDTLKREDYEQAALLRDQIKAIKDEEEKRGGKRG